MTGSLCPPRLRPALQLAGLAVLAALVATPAEAACTLRIERAEAAAWNAGGGYNVFDRNGIAERFELEVRRVDADPEPCDAVVTLAPAGRLDLAQAGSRLAFALRPASQRAVLDGDSVTLLGEDLLPQDLLRLDYEVVLLPGQIVAAGRYRGALLAEVRRKDGGLQELEDSEKIPVTARVRSNARIGFAGTSGRRQTVDFGELTEGKTPGITPQILVQSTSDFSLEITSENRGALAQRADGGDWRIPYSASIGGQPLTLERGAQSVDFRGPTVETRRLPIEFRIESIERQRAGVYRDTVTIVVTPEGAGF